MALIAILSVVISTSWFILELRQSRADAAELRQELDASSSQVQSLQGTSQRIAADLEQRSSELSVMGDDLRASRNEIERLTSNLKSAEDELAGLESTLAETTESLQTQQQRTTLQAGQIGVLKACLSGVSEALYWAAYQYWSLAGAALNAVERECDQAASLLG